MHVQEHLVSSFDASEGVRTSGELLGFDSRRVDRYLMSSRRDDRTRLLRPQGMGGVPSRQVVWSRRLWQGKRYAGSVWPWMEPSSWCMHRSGHTARRVSGTLDAGLYRTDAQEVAAAALAHHWR